MNRRSVLGMTATTTIGLALSHARIFAQASGPGPEMSALSAYMSAAGTRIRTHARKGAATIDPLVFRADQIRVVGFGPYGWRDQRARQQVWPLCERQFTAEL